MYGLEHHIVEISGDVTDAGRTNDERRTREDRATQPMDAGWLSFATIEINFLVILDVDGFYQIRWLTSNLHHAQLINLYPGQLTLLYCLETVSSTQDHTTELFEM